MLKFYGIRFNKQGTPERFTLSFSLRESLNASLYIHDYFHGDLQKTTKAIDEEIDKLFQNAGEVKKQNRLFRFTVAKWFRTKDIVRFIYRNEQTSNYKLEIARILNTPEPIEEKWRLIEPIFLFDVLRQSAEECSEQLSDPESDLNLTLQMINLFFLEQDDEIPPANLELQFIRYQFPKIIWKKRDGFNVSSNPFWIPKNPYCRLPYLSTRIVSRIYETARDFTGINEQPALPAASPSFDLLFPDEGPDEIRLEFEDGQDRNNQAPLIPETAAETLLSLQKTIQRNYSHDGVKHLLGIFRQLAEVESEHICGFNAEKHLTLVARPTGNGTFTEKQRNLFSGVFRTLLGMRVKRFWSRDGQTREISNPLLLEFAEETAHPGLSGKIRKILLDPIFFPSRHNPFRLGGHLMLIPEGLFRESTQKHALLPGLASFLTGTWLNDFAQKKGIAEKTTREIIEGCAFNVTSSNKYRIVRKLKSELVYMEEKCYIAKYKLDEDKDGNPWNDMHRISASDETMNAIAEKMRMINANHHSERLIA
ncbi:MAG: hypothetical protein GY866_00615 [Proteobacteria bacterium]|nr:hypothetical protein [Pseudomonadota bacterium]